MGSMTNLRRFRVKVSDPYRPFAEEFNGDGTTKTFALAHWPVQSGAYTAWVDGVAQAETANYTAEVDAGRLRFMVAPPTGAVVSVVGHYSIFSDTEMGEILGEYSIATGATAAAFSEMDGAHILLIESLMGDAAKRASWAAAGGQSVSEGQLFQNMEKMRAMLVAKTRGAELGPLGGVVAWSEQQENYDEPYSG